MSCRVSRWSEALRISSKQERPALVDTPQSMQHFIVAFEPQDRPDYAGSKIDEQQCYVT